MALLFYSENHLDCIAGLHTQCMSCVPVHNGKLNKLFAVDHRDQFPGLLLAIGICDTSNFTSAKAE